MKTELIVTYTDYQHLMEILVQKLNELPIIKQITHVYGVPRGGLPIAVHVSHHLNLELCLNVENVKHENLLVVDDVADQGTTLLKYPKVAAAATLFYKKTSKVVPSAYVLTTDKWIVFPWEKLQN